MTVLETRADRFAWFAQSILGRRGIIKAIHVWFPIAALVTVDLDTPPSTVAATCLRLFFAAFCYSQVSILANDLADRADDIEARKARWIARLPAGAGVAIVVVVFLAGCLAMWIGRGPSAAVGAYAIACALGVVYSARPFRLKERGLLGPVSYSLSTVLAYVAMPWCVLSSGVWMLLLLSAGVFADKWTNLHFHQVIDFDADRRSGTSTMAVGMGIDRSRETLRWTARAASVAMLGCVILVAIREPLAGGVALGLGVVTAAAVGIRCRRVRRTGQESDLARHLPWDYLGLTTSTFRVVPLVLFVCAVPGRPHMWLVALSALIAIGLELVYVAKYRYE